MEAHIEKVDQELVERPLVTSKTKRFKTYEMKKLPQNKLLYKILKSKKALLSMRN